MAALKLPVLHNNTVYNRTVAKNLGLPAAIILARIVWSINDHIKSNDKRFYRQDRWWMYNTKAELMQYSMLSRHQIDLALKKLRQYNLILTQQFDLPHGDAKNYYAINDKVDASGRTNYELLISDIPMIRKPDDGVVRKPDDLPYSKSRSLPKSRLTPSKDRCPKIRQNAVDNPEAPKEKFKSDKNRPHLRSVSRQVSTLEKNKTGQQDQNVALSEAQEVLVYYEKKFGPVGKRKKQEFELKYKEVGAVKKHMLKAIDSFNECLYFLGPTTKSPMRLFFANSLFQQRTALKYKIWDRAGRCFDRRLAMINLEMDEALNAWFSGDIARIRESIQATISGF